MEREYMLIQADAKTIQQIFNIQHCINDEVKLHMMHDGIQIHGVDPAHVEMISQQIPKQSFYVYDVEPEYYIALDLDKIKEIFKNVTKTDTCQIMYDSGKDKDNIFISIGSFKHKLSIVDLANIPDAKKPTLNLPGEVEFNIKTFYEFLRQADKIDDHFSMTTDNTGLTLHASSDTNQEITVHINVDDLHMINSGSIYKSSFSTDYVYNTVKPLRTCFESCNIHIGNDVPMEMTLKNKWEVNVLIAPRIEQD